MNWQAFDRWFFLGVTEGPFWLHALVLVPLGFLIGHRLWWWAERMAQDRPFGTAPQCPACQHPLGLLDRCRLGCPRCKTRYSAGRLATAVALSGLFVLLDRALIGWRGQSLTEGGSVDWFHVRLTVQLVFVTLLLAGTLIDLKCFMIPDEITVPGAVIGVASAIAAGNLQFVPAWIDFNDPMTFIYGPHIPQWIKDHAHWHGAAVSLSGLVAGAGLTWLVRIVSGLILQQEALGFGDVTFMAMIGSFLGWQPVVMVFLLAPLCGLMIGLAAWLVSYRAILPYGPYLAAATLVVLCGWKWLWIPSRKIFSDPQALAILFAIMAAGLIILLGLIRLYRLIPVETRRYRS